MENGRYSCKVSPTISSGPIFDFHDWRKCIFLQESVWGKTARVVAFRVTLKTLLELLESGSHPQGLLRKWPFKRIQKDVKNTNCLCFGISFFEEVWGNLPRVWAKSLNLHSAHRVASKSCCWCATSCLSWFETFFSQEVQANKSSCSFSWSSLVLLLQSKQHLQTTSAYISIYLQTTSFPRNLLCWHTS